MSKGLTRMMAPTLMLWFFAIATGVVSAIAPDGEGMPKRAELVFSITFPLVIALWVMADARKRGRRLCHDYDSFVYFAWFFVVPVYLFQTRGVRAFLTLLCFAGIWIVAVLIAGAVFYLRALGD